jgi:hypothetical protein
VCISSQLSYNKQDNNVSNVTSIGEILAASSANPNPNPKSSRAPLPTYLRFLAAQGLPLPYYLVAVAPHSSTAQTLSLNLLSSEPPSSSNQQHDDDADVTTTIQYCHRPSDDDVVVVLVSIIIIIIL